MSEPVLEEMRRRSATLEAIESLHDTRPPTPDISLLIENGGGDKTKPISPVPVRPTKKAETAAESEEAEKKSELRRNLEKAFKRVISPSQKIKKKNIIIHLIFFFLFLFFLLRSTISFNMVKRITTMTWLRF
jgi:hypothetical protein